MQPQHHLAPGMSAVCGKSLHTRRIDRVTSRNNNLGEDSVPRCASFRSERAQLSGCRRARLNSVRRNSGCQPVVSRANRCFRSQLSAAAAAAAGCHPGCRCFPLTREQQIPGLEGLPPVLISSYSFRSPTVWYFLYGKSSLVLRLGPTGRSLDDAHHNRPANVLQGI